jgi:hypothetical protein
VLVLGSYIAPGPPEHAPPLVGHAIAIEPVDAPVHVWVVPDVIKLAVDWS